MSTLIAALAGCSGGAQDTATPAGSTPAGAVKAAVTLLNKNAGVGDEVFVYPHHIRIFIQNEAPFKTAQAA